MGQGYSLNVSAGSAGIDVPELADLETERTLGAARFVKTIRARHKDGLVIAKVFIKPYPNLKLDKYVQAFIRERRALADVPNALAYHRILETATNGYLARQYIHMSLYDRISTNPSLEDIEKKWIAFQLLCAVRDCHARDVYHGDIKAENMLVTTWNWLYLTDFSSSFKPTRLPEDNPATFSIFFDTTGRRICYVAPERFATTAELKKNELEEHSDPLTREAREQWHSVNWQMDIFSVGCVIAELFTEKPTFTLPQLFRYRKGDFDPTHTTLNNIKDDNIREMVAHMIQLDPEKRDDAAEYLRWWRGKCFPDYFYTFLHDYLHLMTDPTSGRAPVVVGKKNSGGSDDRIDRIFNDFDKISFFLGFNEAEGDFSSSKDVRMGPGLDLFPLRVDLPNNSHVAADRSATTDDNGALLFLSVVVSSLRTTARAASRLRACELLLALAERLTDEAKLDRVLPFAISLLDDESVNVRIAALRTITQLLAIVTVLSPMNVFIFPNYVLPRLQRFVASSQFRQLSPLRATYAACLASLATTASRFLDMMQALKADGSLPSTDPEAEDDVAAYAAYQNSYDSTREDLIQHFEAQTKIFLTDENPSVRRAFLGSVTSLCVFFGDQLSADLILTHLNTYLNDDDWTLKCAFFDTIVGVAAFIGGPSLEDFVLPLMMQALTDPEETVTEQVIRSLASMARLGLFTRWTIVELVLALTRFTLHPNTWIREAAVQFIAASVTHFSDADAWSMIMPLVKPVLKIPSAELDELNLLDALKKPFPRSAFDMAKTWAEKTEKGIFWTPARQAKAFSLENVNVAAMADYYDRLNAKSLSRAPKNDEDEQWLARLRAQGMRPEDEPKLVALRDYIWRTAKRSQREIPEATLSDYNHMVSLTSLQIPLQNVMFDDEIKYEDYSAPPAQPQRQPQEQRQKQQKPERKNIEEALRDAATASAQDISSPNAPLGALVAQLRQEAGEPGAGLPSGDTKGKAPATQNNGTPSTEEDKSAIPGHKRQLSNIDAAGNLSSSPASILSINSKSTSRGLQHKSSGINLVKRVETGGKSIAETATDSINALGRVDTPGHTNSQAPFSRPASSSGAPQTLKRPTASHSYRGGDPTVMKLLENVYATQMNQDLEFGNKVPVTRRPLGNPNSYSSVEMYWKPQGHLIAVLGEHQAKVNCIAVAPDQAFFITGSDDGTVRVWDTARFERNVTHRSRQVHKHASGARVTCLGFVQERHSFISAASDGSINIVKVDMEEKTGMPRYGKLHVLREWTIPSPDDREEYAVAVDHSRVDNVSQMMIATNLSRILIIDPHTMDIVQKLQNPVKHGMPTSFCHNNRRQWVLVGTSHGVLDLWDLRFGLRLRSWTVRNPHPIWQVKLHSKRDTKKIRAVVSGLTGSGQVSTWDLDKGTCTELYNVSEPNTVPRLSSRDFEFISVDDEKVDLSSKIMDTVSLASPTTPSNGTGTSNGDTTPLTSARTVSRTLESGAGKMLFTMSMHVHPSDPDPRSFLLTAGPDWNLRFWDHGPNAAHLIINNVNGTNTTSDTDTKPAALAVNMLGADMRIFTSRTLALTASTATSEATSATATKAKDSPSPSPSPRPTSQQRRISSPGGGSGGKGDTASLASSGSGNNNNSARDDRGRRLAKVSRYDVIRGSAQHLLRGHKDGIEAIALLERPFGMVVSADRAGVVYVFM